MSNLTFPLQDFIVVFTCMPYLLALQEAEKAARDRLAVLRTNAWHSRCLEGNVLCIVHCAFLQSIL